MAAAFFYKTLLFFTQRFGMWIFSIFLWIVSTGYFLFFPNRIRNSIHIYKELFPNHSFLYYLTCAWKQYHNFTNIYLDRFMLRQIQDIKYVSNGREYLLDAQKNKTGGIIVMSHIGNWEAASHILRSEGFPMLLYMGIKQKEHVERLKKKTLALSGIEVIAVDENSSSPFAILDGVNFLKKGGFISLTGDRIWSKHQRSVNVSFLGHTAMLPEAPYLIALTSGAPLFFFFCSQDEKNTYHFTMSEPYFVKSKSREDRTTVIQQSAQHYANLLEEHLRKHPLEWFHFEKFLNFNS